MSDPEATQLDRLDALLQQALDAYLAAAPLAGLAELRRFLPAADRNTRRFLLAELIKLDLAGRYDAADDSAAAAILIEDYLQQFADVITVDDVPLDLVIREIQLRTEAGQVVDPSEYAGRFPQHAATVAELLGGDSDVHPEATAAVHKRTGPPELELGKQVDDFVIVDSLGSGAFANVYLARQVSMSRLVALKVSKGTGNEPQALSQFDHPGIVRVFDQRLLEQPPIHLLYMQFHPGGTLADVVRRVRNTPAESRTGELILRAVDESLLKTAQAAPERSSLREQLRTMSWPMAVAWIGIQLTGALDHAHRRDVLHRDVKPANVLLSAEGMPKLADFNVSFNRAVGRAGAARGLGGSIGYMAPEHLREIAATELSAADSVGPRADLYSLAILLWELWQGERPFRANGQPGSWGEAVEGQLESRRHIETPTGKAQDALSRLLETILRDALAFDPHDRIASAAEFEARLRLAMHPEAAQLFDPDPGSWQAWWSRRSPWLVTAAVILVPNTIAGAFGWYYNKEETLGALKARLIDSPDRFEAIISFFVVLSSCINLIAFPLAVALMIAYTGQVIRAMRRVESGRAAVEADYFAALQLAHRAAVIGGLLWCLAAVLYPAILWFAFEELSVREISHFFLSHVICGGVAAIYPFFGISVYAIAVCYPRLVRSSLTDAGFDRRMVHLVRRCERYLLLACAVPLLGATLLLVSDEDATGVILVAIAATGIGLFAAFSAYRFIVRTCRVLAPLLSSQDETRLRL
jgi:hypothetical protein